MKWFLLFLLSLSFGSVVQAHPTAICGKVSEITDRLKGQYKEFPKFEGLTATGLLLRIYISKDNLSWTIIHIYPDGSACLSSAGEYWQDVEVFTRIDY